MLERRWFPLETVGVYVPRNLVSTLVMCVVPAQVAGVSRIVVCTPPEGAGLVAAAARLLGVDEVWALGGPQAIGYLAYVERVDKIVGPGNRYVNEAKLEVARDVAIDLPGGPSEVVVVGRRRSTPGSSWSSQRSRSTAPDSVCRAVATLEEAERIAPEHLVLLGDAEREAGRVRNAGAVFVGPWSPVAAGDYATGGNHVLPTNGWARSLGGLGLETFMKPVTFQRLTRGRARARSPDGRGARRGRGDARARGGGAAMRALAPGFRPYEWAAYDAGGRAPCRDRRVAGAALRPEHAGAAARVDAPGDRRRRAGARQRLPGRRLRAAAPRDRGLRRRRARERRARRGCRRPDPSLRPRVRGTGRRHRDPGRADVSALPHRSGARRRRRRRAGRPCSRSRAGRTTRPARSTRSRTRGRSSSTRRTSSTAARRRSTWSATRT